jgi:ubiquinone/menaquinone biosynthesis C-methylase UbiE
MPLPPPVPPDPNWPSVAVAATARYSDAIERLDDRSYWPVIMFSSVNLFLWHLEAFAREDDPVPLFVDAFDRATAFLENSRTGGVCGAHFPGTAAESIDEKRFEQQVSGLFSDIWVGLSDDIYFEQSYAFTKERLEKSGVDPVALFKGKTVVDAGCGSGKFSAAIARFGAARVIGLDIGEKGLEFARKQAEKVPYGKALDYRNASLLDIPIDNGTVDLVWSNGVIHHTTGYERCVQEFSRILKPGGTLFLYVNGRFGLLELLMTTLQRTTRSVPHSLFQHFLTLLGVNSGRLYWMLDFLYAPYEYKSSEEIKTMLRRHGFDDIRQLTRGVASDQIEQISAGIPHARVKYGESQLKYLATKR